jgi:hypothetical protein
MALVNTYSKAAVFICKKNIFCTLLKIINIRSMEKRKNIRLSYDLGPPLTTQLAIIGEENERECTFV